MNGWIPASSPEERLKSWLLPPRLYIRLRLWRERRSGERELALLPWLVDPERLCLDVGANKGVYAEAMSRLCRQVHAFEPNPKAFAILRRCAAGNVICEPVALSDRDTEAELRIPRSRKGHSNQHGSLSATAVREEYDTIAVRTRRLDSLDLGPVGFIKIDVEGHESSVLRGARETLARNRPNLLIELEERHTERPLPELVAEVETYGYRALYLHDRQLRDFSAIDLEREHRHPRSPRDYVFNFVFLPVGG